MADRNQVLMDLAAERAGFLTVSDLVSKYSDQLGNIVDDLNITGSDVLKAENELAASRTGTGFGGIPSPGVTLTGVTPGEKPAPPEPSPPSLPSPFPEAPTLPGPGGVGLPSLDIDLPGIGDSLAKGNESGILGTPQQEILGTGFGPPTVDLQEAIRDQARAAEDSESRLGPPGDIFRPVQEESIVTKASPLLNLGSNILTGAKLAGKTIPSPVQALQGIWSLFNLGSQIREDERRIQNPNLLGSIGRSILGRSIFGDIFTSGDDIIAPDVDPGNPPDLVPTTDSRLFEIARNFGRGDPTGVLAPVTLPPEIEDVTTESFAAPTDPFDSTFSEDSHGIFEFDQGGIVTL